METHDGAMAHVTRGVTVCRPVEEVYRFWRNLENLPRFMTHLEAVTVQGDHSHWVATGPAGMRFEWDAAIVEDVPNARISWKSLPGSAVESEGSVRFAPAPADRGTEIRVSLRYAPPAGRAGAIVATLFGEEPDQQIRDDLRRFKQVMEIGEVVRSEGSLEGAGQGMSKQRPAQAAELEARP